MSKDIEFVKKYTTWKDENERINASIISEERKEAYLEGKNAKTIETVINMNKKNFSIDIIAEITNLSIEEVKKIIDDNNN